MHTNPIDPLNAFRKLAAAVQEDSRVPYAFESRVMRRATAITAVNPHPFAKFLWRGAITSLVCAVLSGSFLFVQYGDLDEEEFGELDEAQSIQLEME